jgi:hypothetical protein
MRCLLTATAALCVLGFSTSIEAQPANDYPFDFALREDFVRALKEGSIRGHSAVHPIASDFEMHIAGEGMLEFREEGGGSCGNFSIVALTLYKKEWVHKISGGHAAIVRGRAGAGEPFDLKAYTLEGTDADKVFEKAASGGSLKKAFVLGLITYDFFNINR